MEPNTISLDIALWITVVWGGIMFVLGLFLGARSTHKKYTEMISDVQAWKGKK